MPKYPKGLRHQAPGCELELKTPPGQSLTLENQTTDNEIDLERDGLLLSYYHTRISASRSRDMAVITGNEDMTQDTTVASMRHPA